MAENPETAIQVQGLSKHFKDIKAVDSIDFSVETGDVFGFMGHNGAGKTTAIRMLLGLTKPSEGTATVLGHDIVKESLEVRRRCGFLPADFSLPRDMTPVKFLTYIASMFKMSGTAVKKKIEELLTLFELTKVATKKLRGFSTGMAQKVGLAQALINEPQVIFLDEPTAGLDPIGRHGFLTHIKSLAHDHGVTVMFSTHILTDIESICEHVAILHHGQLIAKGKLDELKRDHGQENMDDLYLKLVKEAG
jgi:ABC-2 type transport system ATP-binding protein